MFKNLHEWFLMMYDATRHSKKLDAKTVFWTRKSASKVRYFWDLASFSMSPDPSQKCDVFKYGSGDVLML